MATTYQDLINKGGEITNQSTGRVYPNPQELAGDLGIAPHQIDWSQITAAGGQGNTGTTTANPITGFNTALMGKLKEYQGLSSADLIKRQSAILKKLYAQQAAITPEEQRVLSPSQQSAIRGGKTQALRPELEATKGQILDRKEARSRFLEMVGVAQDMSQQLEDVRGQQRDTALQALEIRAQAGDAMTPQEINDLAGLTGWDSQTIQSYFDVASQKAQSERTLQELKIAGARKDLSGTGALTTYEKEWNAAGGQSGTGMSLSDWIMKRTGVDDAELSDFDLDIDGAANVVIDAEGINPELSGTEFSKAVKTIAIENKLEEEYVKAKLIQKIQEIKGTQGITEPSQPETIQEVEENIGSDFNLGDTVSWWLDKFRK